MLNRALGKDKAAADAPPWAAALLAQLDALAGGQGELLAAVHRLDARVAALEASTGRVTELEHDLCTGHAAAVARQDGLLRTVRLPAAEPKQVVRGVAEVAASLVGQLAALAHQAARQGERLERLGQRLAALERRQQEGGSLLRELAAAQREGRDQLEALLAQHQDRLSGADAVALLARLLRSPQEAPPLFRRGELICFRPRVAEEWLRGQGLSRAEVAGVRRVWRDAGLVPSEAADNLNKRLRVAGGRQAYYLAVPARTYTDLRVPVPRGLPADPPD